MKLVQALGALTAAFALLVSPVRAEPSEAQRTHLRAIYEHIVNMNTSVSGGQTPAMAAYLAGLFRDAGFPESDVHLLPYGQSAALVVRYRGDGSRGRPILLMAHRGCRRSQARGLGARPVHAD